MSVGETAHFDCRSIVIEMGNMYVSIGVVVIKRVALSSVSLMKTKLWVEIASAHCELSERHRILYTTHLVGNNKDDVFL